MKKFMVLFLVCFPLLFQSGVAQDTLWSVKAFDGVITSAKFSIGGDIIIHTDGGYIVKRDLAGRLLDSFWVGQQFGMVLTPDGRSAITYTPPFLYQWDLITKKVISRYEMAKDSTFGEYGHPGSIDISRDGKYIGEIGTVYPPNTNQRLVGKFYIWDAQTKNIIYTDTAGCTTIKFSPNNDEFCISDKCKMPDLWSVSKKIKETGFSGTQHQKQITNSSFSPDGNYLCTSNSNDGLFIWDLKKKLFIKIVLNPTTISAFSNDSKYIIGGGNNLFVYDLHKESYIYGPDKRSLWGAYSDVQISVDSKFILASEENNLSFYDFNKLTSSIQQQSDDYLIIKPNPTNGNINIPLVNNYNTPYNIHVFNISGVNILTYLDIISNNGNIIIDLGDLPYGIYFLVLSNLNFSQTYKLVKE